jgi:hypothetical protein
MEVKAEIAKKIERGERVSNKYLARHNKGVARVIGHTAIGDFDAKLVSSQEGSESWKVIVTVASKAIWVEYPCGRHIPYKQPEFNAQFTTGSENDLATVGATVNHPVYKEGKVTHVIIDYTMEHDCTAFINNRRRPTKPWECSCVRFVNTQEHCDGLMHLLVTIFRTDPLDEKLIRPMHNILCHPLATAACGEMGIGLPGGSRRDVVEFAPNRDKVSAGMFLIDASKYAAEVKRVGSDRNGSDAQLDRYHKINDSFKKLVPIAQKSDANAAVAILSLTACFEHLTTTCPAGGSIVVDGKQGTMHIASGQAPTQKRPREAPTVHPANLSVSIEGGGDTQASKARRPPSCTFCSKYFDVDNSKRDLSHSKADKCMLKKHPYDPKGHWVLSHASVLGSNWTKDDNVEFKLPSGRSYYVEIPVARYPTAKAGDKFRLVVGGLSHVFSEEHLLRAPLWGTHKMP